MYRYVVLDDVYHVTIVAIGQKQKTWRGGGGGVEARIIALFQRLTKHLCCWSFIYMCRMPLLVTNLKKKHLKKRID